MPRGTSKNAKNFREVLEKGVILVAGEEYNNDSIDLGSSTKVQVAIVFNVTGFGPHVGVICAGQGIHVDAPLEAASELLEEWEQDKYGPDISTETYDGQVWELDPKAFEDAIEGTTAVQFFDLYGDDDDDDDDDDESDDDEE